MEAHFELNDAIFERQFKNLELDPAIFSHEAHLRLAWIHIKKYGVEKAIENVCGQLLDFVNFLGARDKYNKTLTVAAIRAVYHFMKKEEIDTFYDFIQTYPRLKSNFKELMAFHYKIDIFNSESAKKTYLEPDLVPFD